MQVIRFSQNDHLCIKNAFSKTSPKVISYRGFKNFENERFVNFLKTAY